MAKNNLSSSSPPNFTKTTEQQKKFKKHLTQEKYINPKFGIAMIIVPICS